MPRSRVIWITAGVLALWLVVAAVTKYTLEEAALLMPVVVVLVGIAAALVIFWTRFARDRSRKRS